MDHLFCNCPLAIDVWRSVSPPHLDMSIVGIIPWKEKIVYDKMQGSHNLAFLLVICWQIWDTRKISGCLSMFHPVQVKLSMLLMPLVEII
jgi:hypothetical protein